MTDAEKTQVLVDKLFGGKAPQRLAPATIGYGKVMPFSPFTSIEDAFMCVEKGGFYIDLSGPCDRRAASPFWICTVHDPQGSGRSVRSDHADIPARAIAEAIYLAVQV